MISDKELFLLFDGILDYEILIAPAEYPLNVKKGTLLLSALSSSALTNSNNSLLNTELKTQSHIKTTYQADLFNFRGVVGDANKLREYLNSAKAYDYVKSINAQLLPCYNTISYTREFSDLKQWIQRAFFSFDVITLSSYSDSDIALADSVFIDNKLT